MWYDSPTDTYPLVNIITCPTANLQLSASMHKVFHQT
jgi:hypothetical protein